MKRRRHLKQFPNHEECEQCHARRYYIQDGLFYCERGHLQEGRRQVEIDDEEGIRQASQGHVSRKAKEAKTREARHFTGAHAKQLYLQCLQLLLHKQVYKLVHDKHLPEDLLGVVRDLWDLRIRGFSSPTSSSTSEVLVSGEGKQNKEDPAALSADVSDELAFFASQSGADASETEQRASIARTKVQDWTCGRPDDWKPPKIIETLAMSYLGCLLMRLPVRIGDIFRWAKANEIPYLGAIGEIPKNMRDRLPGTYHIPLNTQAADFTGGDLHDAVISLAKSYYHNYKYPSFPAMNTPPVLLQYLLDLALPPEIYVLVGELGVVLGSDFTIPVEKAVTGALENPDILLATLLAIAVKLLHPFDPRQRSVAASGSEPYLQMDWNEWEKIMRKVPMNQLSQTDMRQLTAEGAWRASLAELEGMADAYTADRSEDSDGADPIKKLFPVTKLSLGYHQKPSDPSNEEEQHRVTREVIVRAMKRIGSAPEAKTKPEERDERTTLGAWSSGPEKAFHERLAYVAGLEESELLHSISKLERRLERESLVSGKKRATR